VLVESTWSGAVKKDSLVRLGMIQPIRESEIEDHYAILSPGEMYMVDKELRNLLFDKDSPLFAGPSSTVQPKSKLAPASVSVPKSTPEPFLGKSHKPIRKLDASQSQRGKRKKPKK